MTRVRGGSHSPDSNSGRMVHVLPLTEAQSVQSMVIYLPCNTYYRPNPRHASLPPFFGFHTLIIAAEMLFAVTSTKFTTPSTVFAYCLLWIFPIEAVPQWLMISVFHGRYFWNIAISPITEAMYR